MKILLSAYACEPGKGSEPEVGLRALLAAAAGNEVWVVTRENNLEPLERFLENHPARSRIHLIGFDLDERSQRIKKRLGRLGTVWYYQIWQKGLRDRAAQLDRAHDFDVLHHITFATYWAPVGVAAVEKPLVIGPVGGGVTAPLGLLRAQGLRATASDLLSRVSRPMLAALSRARRDLSTADVIFTQNRETMRLIGRPDVTEVLPNGLVGAYSVANRASGERPAEPRFVFAGRLIGWKGAMLAIEAVAAYPDPSATLDIYGGGPMEKGLHEFAQQAGVSQKVTFHGPVGRSELMDAISTCTALIHPALHEDSGLVIAEALASGTPVVCLDRGGPPEILQYWPSVPSRAVPPGGVEETVRGLTQALAAVAGGSAPPNVSPADEFGERLLAAYEQVARP